MNYGEEGQPIAEDISCPVDIQPGLMFRHLKIGNGDVSVLVSLMLLPSTLVTAT